jgi:hypothetical protein
MKIEIILISSLLLITNLLSAQPSPLNADSNDNHMVFLNYRFANEKSMLLPGHMIEMHRNLETAPRQSLSLGFANNLLLVADTLVLSGAYTFDLTDNLDLIIAMENKASWLITGDFTDEIDGNLSLDFSFPVPLKGSTISPLGVPSNFRISNSISMGYSNYLTTSLYSIEDSFLSSYINSEELQNMDLVNGDILSSGFYGEVKGSLLLMKNSWISGLDLAYLIYYYPDFTHSLNIDIYADYILTGSKGMIGLVGLSAYCDYFDPDGISGLTLKAVIAKIILNINLQDIKLYSIAESDPSVSVLLGWRF